MFNKNSIKKSLRLIILCFLVYCPASWAMIQEIDTLAQAQEELQKADDTTLVLFDVDETLAYYPDDWSLDFLYHPKKAAQEDAEFVQQAYAAYEQYEKEKGAEFVRTLVRGWSVLKSKGKLIEPNAIIRVIDNLKLHGAKVIALTHFPVGKYGVLECAHATRFEDLQNLNIDFSSAFPQEEIVLDCFARQNNNYPLFYKGILLTNGINCESPEKGTVLGAFLDKVKNILSPTKVLFFDDSKSNLESVEQEMAKRGIAYHGYWYRAEKKLPRPKLNQETAKIRLAHLLEHDEYLTDAEAEAILQNTHCKEK